MKATKPTSEIPGASRTDWETARDLIPPERGTVGPPSRRRSATGLAVWLVLCYGAAAWQVINDDVMGGVSTSLFRLANGTAVFQGEVSLKNNGGFASVRSLPARHDLAGGDAFLVRVRGDGQRYKLTARTDRSFDTVIYQAVVTTRKGEWEEHRLPMRDFVPTFRGRVLSGEPPLDPAKVTSVGFLISDHQVGLFRLEVAWIKVTALAEREA